MPDVIQSNDIKKETLFPFFTACLVSVPIRSARHFDSIQSIRKMGRGLPKSSLSKSRFSWMPSCRQKFKKLQAFSREKKLPLAALSQHRIRPCGTAYTNKRRKKTWLLTIRQQRVFGVDDDRNNAEQTNLVLIRKTRCSSRVGWVQSLHITPPL